MQQIRPYLILLAFVGCSKTRESVVIPRESIEPYGPAWFADATDAMGVNFVHRAGSTGTYLMPQTMGSGVAVLDFNNDERFDLLFLNNAGPGSGHVHRLWRQNAGGKFEDVTVGSGIDFEGYGMGIAIGDIDNDGWVDVYISQYGGGRLLKNRGNGQFQDITTRSGVAQPRWGTSCSFCDLDRDGWLDLVIANYIDYDPSRPCQEANGKTDYCHPNQFPGTAARCFRNKGCNPKGDWLGYEDTTQFSGIASLPSNGLGVVCGDFDGDGWPDLFFANDARPNHLWINQRNGRFTEQAVLRGLAYDSAGNVRANMGIAQADFDGDGRFDIFVTHLSEERHTLWKQDSLGQFRDATSAMGLASPKWQGTGFGTIGIDFDCDGHIDLAVANGRVIRGKTTALAVREGLPPFWQEYAERNQLFANLGNGKFRDVSPDTPAFTGHSEVSRGLAWADLDNDGRVDLISTSIEGKARLFRNIAPNPGHWLIVRTYDGERKRDAYGAVVTLEAGKRRWVVAANPGQSYCCSGDPRAHFGLGAAETFDSLRVDWPDGNSESFSGGAVDRVITIRRGAGRAVVR